MRLFLVFVFLFWSAKYLFAQITPRYSQFLLNPFIYNPAFAGGDSKYECYLNHRRQWIGIDQAPVASTMGFHTRLITKGFRQKKGYTIIFFIAKAIKIKITGIFRIVR